MTIKVVAVGKTKEAYLQEAIQEYVKRLRRYTAIEYLEIKTEKRDKKSSGVYAVRKECEKIRQAISPHDRMVALDEHGQQYTSVEFAQFIARCQADGKIKTLTFVTGGPTGFSEEFLREAPHVLSLSTMTFPHQFCRLIVCEQVYRAYTIIAGESYHKQ